MKLLKYLLPALFFFNFVSVEIFAANEDLKVLAEGSYSTMEKPFVFVARSKESYAELQNFAENLPDASKIDFSKTAIVAAFAGTKNTGGYSVEMRRKGETIFVKIVEPPKDAFVTQVITSPFKVAAFSLENGNALRVEMPQEWKKSIQNYKIKIAEFEYSGGFTGRGAKFKVEGTISILQSGDFATVTFNLAGKKAEKSRKLFQTATGTIKNGKIFIGNLDAGTFAGGPKPPLNVDGLLSKNKLSLNFESLPPTVSESFQVQGKIEAVKSK